MTLREFMADIGYDAGTARVAINTAFSESAGHTLTDLEIKGAIQAHWCRYDLGELAALRAIVPARCTGAHDILDTAEVIIEHVNAEYPDLLPVYVDVPF